MRSVLFVLFAFVLAANQFAVAQDVDYLGDVKPIFQSRCFACHGALKQESELRLDTAASIRRGGDSGPAIVVGNAAKSLLLEKVTAADADERMPPEGDPLTKQQIVALRNWINSGALAPADEKPEKDPRSHWAFQPPLRPDIPRADNGVPFAANPIDAFILAERQRRNLKPVEVVEKSLLLRRVYVDLIGLPPTRDELHTFLADKRKDAYEQVVDQLLRSPHYGERWGRHWMDIWRYTDWFGLGAQLRYSQKHIWHWRDWIIESLNADKGYDQMIVEMLAADEVKPTDYDALRATGFLARNYFLFNRTTWLDDTIEHTSKALLGLTFNCCKCHDHKYDPISQVDYYRMRAIFEPHQVRLDTVPGQTDLEINGLPRAFDAHPDATTYLHIRGDAKNLDKSRLITPGVPAVLEFEKLNIEPIELPPQAHNPALRQFVLDDHLRMAKVKISAAHEALSKANAQLAKSEQLAAASAASPNKPNEAQDPPREATKLDGPVFLHDDFAKADVKTWETGPGKWGHKDGKLVQTQTGLARAYLRTRSEHPSDFHATLKFKTNGGQMWKSVGLAFDVVNGREKLVYMSAVTPGSKLQISYKTGANHTYPADAKVDRAVKLNEMYVLSIAVRGQLVNIAINGAHTLAYQLPVKREAGRIDLVAFDAAAEFHDLQIQELPGDATLVQASKPAAKPDGPLSLAQAKAAVTVAEKMLAVAELHAAALKAAHAADIARHQPEKPENLSNLVRAAVSAARQLALARAEQAVAQAKQKLTSPDAKTKAAGDKELKAAAANLKKLTQTAQKPSDKYSSFTAAASLKALEGPGESDASRRAAYPTTSTGRRTALARWIVHPKNPLTARVAVNHIWSRHFGQPLVETVTDFGLRAPQPPQHALLDWLAVELMKNDWSTKHLHRLIVTSHTYRLRTSTAAIDANTKKADPNNKFYWRRTPVRMESQVVRDSLLHLAGVLDPKLGGPTIDPKKDAGSLRRSIYFTHSRDDQHKFLSMFDDADILRCYRRSESIIPQQALALANSRLSLAMARKIAERLDGDINNNDEAFVAAVFETLLCRRPDSDEMMVCLEALTELAKSSKQDNATPRARANFVHAILNHNDFVTVR
jgi:hypothetical protein